VSAIEREDLLGSAHGHTPSLRLARAHARRRRVCRAVDPRSSRQRTIHRTRYTRHISGVVAGSDGALIAGASLYVYQTDHEGYYGVKPASDNRNPRLKLFLRSDAKGAWSFDTIRPGSYPNSKIPAHIHFEVSAKGYANRVFEIVFEGDPYLDLKMRKDPAFSVRTVEAGGRVSERIEMKRQ